MAYTEMHILGQVEIMEDGMIGYLYIDIKSIRNESRENSTSCLTWRSRGACRRSRGNGRGLRHLRTEEPGHRPGFLTERFRHESGRLPVRHYRHRFHIMQVGTGDSLQTTSFYLHCGFNYSHTLENFFTDNYDHLILEEGKMLKDMLYFSKWLK